MSPRIVYRIATDAPTYPADDLSGKGAERTGGRWNTVGVPLVYTSSTRALACLETVVHLPGPVGLALNRYLVEISIPDDIWAARTECDVSTLVGWDAEPASLTSTGWGSRWAQKDTTALASVPSIVVPEELNILINPRHQDAGPITARKVRKWLFDARLRGSDLIGGTGSA